MSLNSTQLDEYRQLLVKHGYDHADIFQTTGATIGERVQVTPPSPPPPTGTRFGLIYAPRPAGYPGGSLTPPPKVREKKVAIGQDLKAVVGTLAKGDTILLQRGGKYTLKNSGITVTADEIHFNAYGEGAPPIIEMDIGTGGTQASKKSMAAIAVPSLRRRVFIQNINFSAIERGYTDYTGVSVGDNAVDVTIDHCNALTHVVDTLVKSYGDGTRVFWCDAPNGVNAYGVFFGDTSNNCEMECCYINDSKNESCYRAYGKNHRIVGNRLIKRKRTDGGIKCYIRNQYGENHYIAGNRCESPDGQAQIIIGPIGTDGTHSSAEKSVNFVMENNVCTGIAQFQFNYGVVNAIIRNNVFEWANPTHTGIEVTKWADAPGRVSPTAVFENNKVKAGSFIVNAPAGIVWKGKGNLLNGVPV